MRFALLLRQRRVQLLRRMDQNKGNSPAPFSGRFVPPAKRSASQAAAALKTDDSRKHARVGAHDATDQSQGQSASQKTAQGFVAIGHQSRFGHAQHSHLKPTRGRPGQSKKGDSGRLAVLPEPLLDEAYIQGKYAGVDTSISLKGSGISSDWKKQPKASLTNFMTMRFGQNAHFGIETGLVHGKKITRCVDSGQRVQYVRQAKRNCRATVKVVDDVIGMGDGANRREAEHLASLAACYEIIARGLVRLII